jgi:DTW domain-containing protein YfiP
MPYTITICCHPKEWQKTDNTAHWAWLSSDDIKRFKWHRKIDHIDNFSALQYSASSQGTYLLYPSDDALDINDTSLTIEELWVVDGTWQEAQKMLRQSPWLDSITKVKIPKNINNQALESKFELRRNQRGLSTLEAISEAVSEATSFCSHPPSHIQPYSAADCLNENFQLFQQTLLELKK